MIPIALDIGNWKLVIPFAHLLPREQRLRKTGDFKAVYKRGRSYVHPSMVAYVLNGRGEAARIGFSISKKLGGATTRNRIKRRLREAGRPLIPRLKPGTDIVIVARGALADSTVLDMRSVLENLLGKARAL